MQKQYLLYVLIGFILFSCSQKEEKKNETNSSFSEVYQLSETALLMEEMYDILEKNRPMIIEGKSIGNYPSHFSEIHTAKMSKGFERNEEFKKYADVFLQNIQKLYEVGEDDPNRKAYYNNVVNSCITCHKSDAGCMGPVSRIGKLLID